MKNIKEILENKGFSVTDEGNNFFVSQYTPAGEDWGFYLDNLEDIKSYAENFDPDEEFSFWMEARGRVRGVPSPHDLWEDQCWKQDLFNKILNEL